MRIVLDVHLHCYFQLLSCFLIVSTGAKVRGLCRLAFNKHPIVILSCI